MSNEINLLKTHFKSNYLHVSDYWLQCCLEWFNNKYTTYTENFMFAKVYEQWLSLDLRDIEVRSLPPELSKQEKLILPGNYAVQVMSIRNIAKSSLSQLKKIRNRFRLTNYNVDDEPEIQTKRMLMLSITDGVEYVSAFEYQQVDCLKINMTPGIKLLLIGPLLIRNGEILLKNNNVKVLGGEVEEILITNAVENVLARELKMPENPNPQNVDPELINNVANENSATQMNINQNRLQHTVNYNQNIPSIQERQLPILNSNPPTDSYKQLPNNPVENLSVANFTEDEDEYFMLDISVSKEQHRNEPPINNDNTFECEFNDDDFNELEQIQNELSLQDTAKIEFPIKVSSEPHIYIKQLIENRDKITNEKFRVKAQFICVVQKLAVSSVKGWTMKFKITDGTGVIIVDFLNEVLEELVGLTQEAAMLFKSKIKEKNVQASDRLKEALYTCKENLTQLNCFMDIQFTPQVEIPTVVHLKPVNYNDLSSLKLRVDSVYNRH